MGNSTNDSEETDSSSYQPNYQDTCVTYSDGKNTAMLPWKQDHQSLPTYYEMLSISNNMCLFSHFQASLTQVIVFMMSKMFILIESKLMSAAMHYNTAYCYRMHFCLYFCDTCVLMFAWYHLSVKDPFFY